MMQVLSSCAYILEPLGLVRCGRERDAPDTDQEHDPP